MRHAMPGAIGSVGPTGRDATPRAADIKQSIRMLLSSVETEVIDPTHQFTYRTGNEANNILFKQGDVTHAPCSWEKQEPRPSTN